ncbi:putative disease resistance protein At1g50180 [Salvia splendens]|uniref:putative disease resistance protein At1g50180 n=1 Tax=Salvia splendens TaxID=180675 RepID=UPI0011015E06|nr:putative disease resistance protein At1g50180 [Salvia splendens]
MTAYGVVLSLRNTINNIICCSHFRLVGGSLQIIQGVYEELQPLTKVLEILDETSPSRSRKKVNALDGIIKDAIWRFEDSLESLLTRQIPSQYDTLPEIVSIDLQSLENDANSLFQKLNDMKEEYIYEVDNMPQDEPISSFFGFHGTNSKTIGLSDQFEEVKRDLLRFLDYPGWKHVYGLYGAAGVGKTTLAKKIYQDPKIQLIYKRRAWVTVGRVPQPTSQISRGVLAQLTQGDERRLRGKNCLIVLDDVWEREIFDCLNRSIPCVESGCVQVLVTCRHKKMD